MYKNLNLQKAASKSLEKNLIIFFIRELFLIEIGSLIQSAQNALIVDLISQKI